MIEFQEVDATVEKWKETNRCFLVNGTNVYISKICTDEEINLSIKHWLKKNNIVERWLSENI